MTAWLLLLALGSGIGANGAVEVDEDYEKAVNFCATAVFAQTLRDGSADPAQHGQLYDEARERYEKALGGLMEH